jgi:hypothetical protein
METQFQDSPTYSAASLPMMQQAAQNSTQSDSNNPLSNLTKKFGKKKPSGSASAMGEDMIGTDLLADAPLLLI